MSDVDTTKREIDEHEQKGEPHHTRYSDSEARTAVDGANVSINGDADTVDGKHAADLGGITLPDLTRTAGTWYQTYFETIDAWNKSVSGTGNINLATSQLTVRTGTTSGSHARAEFTPGFVTFDPTWDKDRTFVADLNFEDVNGPTFIGSGSVGKGNFTDRHIGFKAVNGDIVGSVADGTTESTAVLVSAAATGEYSVRAELTAGSSVEFYVNGTKRDTISTNIPAGTSNAWGIMVHAENSTSTSRGILGRGIRQVQHP